MPAHAPWFVAGPLLGALVAALLFVANKPLGALGGYVEITDRLSGATPHAGRWRAWFLGGIVAGGLAYALVTGGLHASLAAGPVAALVGGNIVAQGAALLVAGLLIGFGARTAGGCTSGHGLSGMAHGRLASVVATMTFMAVAVGARHALELIAGAPR